MRSTICYIGILVASSVLVGCGQTGALMLPNDENHDKRAKYLIYSNGESKQQEKEYVEAPVQQQFAAPSDSSTSP